MQLQVITNTLRSTVSFIILLAYTGKGIMKQVVCFAYERFRRKIASFYDSHIVENDKKRRLKF